MLFKQINAEALERVEEHLHIWPVQVQDLLKTVDRYNGHGFLAKKKGIIRVKLELTVLVLTYNLIRFKNLYYFPT